jgi:predicted acylesterase/phospholipase RssA
MTEITTISKTRMGSFIETIVSQSREAMLERLDDILRTWHENISESEANDKKFPPLKISIGGTVDLEAEKIETTVRFSATYQSTISGSLPDPSQPELPGV